MGDHPRQAARNLVIYGMDSGVCIINYGMGNLGSVLNAFSFLGHNAVISANPQTIASADAYVLPGVGAFGEAMANLKRTGLVEILAEQVLERKKPFLGICLGLQLLAEDSQEKGFEAGLGWIDGHVVAIPAGSGVRVPHVGWSEVSPVDQTFFTRVADDATFYFDHSFHLVCDPGLVAAKCDHGMPMVAAIRRDNIFATQFHPEKSQKSGLKLLRNFLNFCAAGKG